MKKTIILWISASLLLQPAACSKKQREGWSERADKVLGHEVEPPAPGAPGPAREFGLTKAQQDLIGLETAAVRKEALEEVLEFPAGIVPDPNGKAVVTAPISGWIRTPVPTLGSPLEEDVEVAAIENPENLGRRLSVKAPRAGIVTERSVNQGEWIEAGKEILETTDYRSLFGLIRVDPDRVARVRSGQTAEFTSGAAVLRGPIFFISPTVDPVTRTIEARVRLDNRAGALRAEAFATAAVLIGTRMALVVPRSALIAEESQTVAFVKTAAGFEKRTVDPGLRRGGLAEVLSGLREGEIVVTKGAYQIKSLSFGKSAIVD